MDSLDSMDALHDAINASVDGPEGPERISSDPVPRDMDDPQHRLTAAVDFLSYEVARESGPAAEANARRSGNTDLAALALEQHEDQETEMAYAEAGIPPELWDDPSWNYFVADADGDVGVAAERWNADMLAQETEAYEQEAAAYNEGMAYVLNALAAGEVSFDELPDELAFAVTDYVQEQNAELESRAQSAFALQQHAADAEAYSMAYNFVLDQGGNLNAFVEAIQAGYELDDASTYALNAPPALQQSPERGQDAMDAAAQALYDGLWS
jgi:hypothetical protein